MLRTFKTLIIATAILSLFFLFLTSGEAIEITQMYSTYDDSENRECLYITAYVKTDSSYLYVYWYIDGVQQSISGGPSTSAYFSPSNSSDFPGSHDGTTYTISAVVYQYDPETDLMLSDSSSYDVTVYKGCQETAASLIASVTSCRWNGRTASATSFASIEHTGGDDAPSVTYLLNFGFQVYKLQANGRRADNGDVFNPQPVRSIPGATVNAGDPKVTMGYSNSYTLGNGWDEGDTFEVYTRVTAWGKNNDRKGVEKECFDEGCDTFTIPEN